MSSFLSTINVTNFVQNVSVLRNVHIHFADFKDDVLVYHDFIHNYGLSGWIIQFEEVRDFDRKFTCIYAAFSKDGNILNIIK